MTDMAVDILARTIWGEARGEGAEGMRAVACVVMNRLAIARSHSEGYWWGNTVIQICQARLQFSCWNGNDPNLPKLLAVNDGDPCFATALEIAAAAIAGKIKDETDGATHYAAAGVHAPWMNGHRPCAVIGRQIFYQLVPVPPAKVPRQPQPPTEKETEMTDFKDTFVGKALTHLEDWADHIVHTAGGQEALSMGKDLAKQVVVAGLSSGLAAKTSGGDKNAVLNAAKSAMISVGATVSTADAEKLATHIADSLHPATDPGAPA